MTVVRNLLIVLICCTAVAWLAGPAGRFLVILSVLLFGPGYLLERRLGSPMPVAALVRPALWVGVSLSLVALLYEWATLAGVSLSPVLLGMLTGGCALGCVWAAWHDLGHQKPFASPKRPLPIPVRWWGIAFGLIFGLTVWSRFIQIQDLVVPAWVDSVHHALLIRITAETGQVPYSLRPYLPVDDLPYHWGYHVFTATVMRLSGLPLIQTMLWAGQILNALQVLTCAALAAFLWRRPLAGVAAGLIVGLVSIMPAYYVTWGRYTQLTGLLMLPALAIAWHMLLHTGLRRWLAVTAILLAGMSIVHFRVLVFVGALLAVQALVWAIDRPWTQVRVRVGQGLVMSLLALLLALPWLWVVVAQHLLPAVEQPQDLVGGGSYNAITGGLLWAGVNRWLIPLALLAALWGMARRSRAALVLIGWVCALVVLANPWLVVYLLPAVGLALALWAALQQRWLFMVVGIGLMALNPAFVTIPYFWLITNDAMVISLFVPISALIGGGVCLLADWLSRGKVAEMQLTRPAASAVALHLQAGAVHVRRPLLPLVYLLYVGLSGLALWGAWNSRTIINPVTVFVTPADIQAIEWISENTPEDARFLINAAAWLATADRGGDGGWWLLPLTGRWTSTPPVLFTYGSPEYVQDVRTRSQMVRDFSTGQEEQIYDLIDREQISHIYLTDHSGPLQATMFADGEAFTRVYQQDGVTILAVR